MKPYFLLFAIAYSYCCNANCMLTKLSLDSRTKNSTTIIDGEVTEQHSYWNAEKSCIYTVNKIQVNRILKGNATTSLEIITPGGEVDGKLIVVEPNADLEIGSKGIFFLNNNSTTLDYKSKLSQYEIYGLAQGFIKKDNYSGKYNDQFEQYENKSTVYSLIRNVTGINYREINNTTINNDVNGEPSITLFTPATICAGIQNILTIDGWGFGSKTGQATVQFRDANSTIPTVFTNIPDTSYIISWTDTEIKVLVPGASANRQGGAGSGLFNVILSNGTILSSLSPLNITYNQFEYRKNKIALINQNGLGGYTFTLNTDFSNNTDAKNSFLKALDQWKCKTGINITVNTTTTATSCSNQVDNMNTVSFATNSCPLPAGALAVTYSSYTLCANSPVIPDGFDLVINPNAGFYYGNNSTPSNLFDFESVVLHELGHAFGQGHSSNTAEVMYPSIANGVAKRVLSATSDLTSVNDIVSRSASTSYCGFSKLIRINTTCTNASQTTPITSKFTSDKTTGCIPLTVNFTDQSTGEPTAWKWNITNNNTTISYTSQNPSHTFTAPGSYTVKLIAKNDNSSDSIVKTAVINVAPALSLNLDIVQNISCNGNNNGSIKATPTGGNGNYTYTWNNNQSSSTLSNLSAGNYSVIIRDGYNCSVSGTKSLTQPNKLNLSVSTEPANNKYNAILNVSGGTTPYIFMLNNTNEENSTIITNLNAGNYTLSVKDGNNCIENATFSIGTTTGIKDAENSFEKLDVYPNPATNNINFNFSLNEYKNVKVELFNLSGQTIFQDEYDDIKDKQASVDLSNLSSGTYILKFGLPEGSTYRKILVNR